MSRRSRKMKFTFTKEGFPKPNKNTEYTHDEICWVKISPTLPYWPAQIKTNGGTIFNPKKQKTTKGLKRIRVITLNDPDLSVVLHNKDNVINEAKKHKKRKKDLSKTRMVDRNKLLKWEQKKKDGTDIDYDDILNEFIIRMKLDSVDGIDASIFKQWNDIALNAAEEELKRIAELVRLEAQRQLEHETLRRARAAEMNKADSMKGQIYDGRIWNDDIHKKEGHVLTAGDTIRYWAPTNVANSNSLITTTIIKLRDLYGTLRLKESVAIDVLCDANPPFWNTEIEKLPVVDDMQPVYYPLSQCKFNPSQIENEMEKKHLKERNKFKKGLKDKGWGNMLYNGGNLEGSDGETDGESDGKKSTVYVEKRKRKKRLSDDEAVGYNTNNMQNDAGTDSDVVILDNIINERDSLKLIFEKKKRKYSGKKRKNNDENTNQKRKKRKLNNPKNTIHIDEIMETDVIEGDGDKHMDMDVDDSEDEVVGQMKIWSHNNDSECEITKVVTPKNKKKASDDERVEGASCIPWPPHDSNITKKNKAVDTEGDTTNNAPKKTTAKRKVRRKAQKKATQRPQIVCNYVDDGCCPQFIQTLQHHDDLCPNKGCNDIKHVFLSSSGNGTYDNGGSKRKTRKNSKESKSVMSDISALRDRKKGTEGNIGNKLDDLIKRQERMRIQSPNTMGNKNGSKKKKKRTKTQCKKTKNINKQRKCEETQVEGISMKMNDELEELLAFGETFNQ